MRKIIIGAVILVSILTISVIATLAWFILGNKYKTFENDLVSIQYPKSFEVIVSESGIPEFKSPDQNIFGGTDAIIFSDGGNPYDSIEINNIESCTEVVKTAIESEKGFAFKFVPELIKFESTGKYSTCSFYTEIEQQENSLGMNTKIFVADDQTKYSIIGVYEKNGINEKLIQDSIQNSYMK